MTRVIYKLPSREQRKTLDRLDRQFTKRVEDPHVANDNEAPGFEGCVYVTYRSGSWPNTTYFEYVITRDGREHRCV